MGGLSYQGNATGVLYSFLGTVIQLQGKFNTNRAVFCFDSKKSKRKVSTPTYKLKRTKDKIKTPEEQARLWELFSQIDGLRTRYLKQIGFRNILRQTGYEADDLVASVCKNLPGADRAIVISNDSDLLQLINSRVNVYDPQKQFLWTLKRFREQFGIRNPEDWAIVKAIAGCSSDEVKGIRGIGEKTAVQVLNLKLPVSSKKYQRIVSKEGIEIRKRNLPLVRLPFEGTKAFRLKKDQEQHWSEVLKELGIQTLSPDLEFREKPK
jgi:DNA polymerase-1